MRIWDTVLLVGTLCLWMANNVFMPLTSFQPCMSRLNSLQVAWRQVGPSWPSTRPARTSRIRASVPVVGFMTVLAKWLVRMSMWYGSFWTEWAMTRLQVWLDRGVTVGIRRGGACGVGHGGILGIFTLGGAGAYGILGGGGVVDTLGSEGAVGNLGRGGVVGTGTLGGGAGRPDQRVIGGMVGRAGLGTVRAKYIILDNCISACVC